MEEIINETPLHSKESVLNLKNIYLEAKRAKEAKEELDKKKSEYKKERILLSEQNTLIKYKKEKERKRPKYYFFYMIFILCLVYVVDEVATSLPNMMMSEISLNFFGTTTNGVSTLELFETLANAWLIVGFFYKALADKYGRKPFLFINTIGMTIALVIIYLSPNLVTYVIGFFLLRFFVTPDEQIVYIFETSPKKHRGAIYSAVKGIAELGLYLIPLGRKFLMRDIPEEWRMAVLIPMILGLVISFAVLLFARETDPFLDSRIKYLSLPEEEREKIRNEKKNSSKKQGGFIAGLKYAFKDKQLRMLFIVTFLFCLARTLTSKYTPIMSANAYTTEEITNALFIFPLFTAIIVFAYGFLSDKVGRKLTSVVLLVVCFISLVMLVVGAYNHWNAYVIGIFIGCFLACSWSNGDTLMLICGESSPTNLRASILSGWTGAYGVGMVLSMALGSIIIGLIPESSMAIGLSIFCVSFAIPCYAASAILTMIFVKETKGVAINAIENEEEGIIE